MSLINLFIKLFVTKDIVFCSIVSLVLTCLIYLVAVLYIIVYILLNKAVMDKIPKFLKKIKTIKLANITQLVRVLGCGSKSHRFKSCYLPF